MASALLYDTCKTFLQTTFAGQYPVVDYDSIDGTKEQGNAPFLVLEDITAEEEVIAFGDPQNLCMRQNVMLLIYAYTPAPESSRAARRIGDQIVSAVRLATLPNRIRVLSADPPEIEDANDGLWTIATVAVNLEYDFFAPRP